MTILSKKKITNDKRNPNENDKDSGTHANARSIRLDSNNRNRNSTASVTSVTSATNRWSPSRLDDATSLNDTINDSNDLNLSLGSNSVTTSLINSSNNMSSTNTIVTKRKIRGNSPSSSTRSVRSRITTSGSVAGTSNLMLDRSSSDDSGGSQNNSEDEYDVANNELREYFKDAETLKEIESTFNRTLKEKRGFIIKPMKEDGACLFRAVADQIYGDEEMHSVTRNHCMDYIYMTEDVDHYVSRKRHEHTHGNHIEMIALAEIFNRPIEVYEYSTEPKNTFQSVFQTDNEPIRLSYHGRNHYNSVVDPYKATIGVGLGLPSYMPGLAEKNLMTDALKKSEEFHIEKTMLDDKLKATDWEATNEEIMELVARESYLQWLKDNEKRQNTSRSSTSFTSSPMATCSSWDNNFSSSVRNSPSRDEQQTKLKTNRNIKTVITNNNTNLQQFYGPSSPSSKPKQNNNNDSADLLHLFSCLDLDNENINSNKNTNKEQENLCNNNNNNTTNNENIRKPYVYYETQGIIDRIPPSLYGINDDWEGDASDEILAQVLAVSQQEYLDNFKKQKTHEDTCTNNNTTTITNNQTPSTSSNINNENENDQLLEK